MTEGQERLHAGQDATLARRRKRTQGVCEFLKVRKRDIPQRLGYESEEACRVATIRSLRIGTTAVQPQLEQLLVAAGSLVRSKRDPALGNGAWRMQDNSTYHAFRLPESRGVNKNALCYNSV